jgi:hypothetical protein
MPVTWGAAIEVPPVTSVAEVDPVQPPTRRRPDTLDPQVLVDGPDAWITPELVHGVSRKGRRETAERVLVQRMEDAALLLREIGRH